MAYYDDDRQEDSSLIQDANGVRNSVENAKNTANNVTDAIRNAREGSGMGLEASKEAAKGIAEGVGKEAAKQASKEVAKQAVKEGAKAALGTATGGVGAVAIEVASHLDIKKVIFAITIPLVLLFIAVLIMLTPMLYMINKTAQVVRTEKATIDTVKNLTYSSDVLSKQEFFDSLYEQYGLTDADLNSPFDIYGKSNTMNMEIMTKIIDQAIDYCFCADDGYIEDYLFSDNGFLCSIQSFFDVYFNFSRGSKTYLAYLNARYPYTLATPTGYYTIEDYMHTPKTNDHGEWDACTWKNKIPLNEINNDVNYAEIISCLMLNEDFQSKNYTLSELYDLLLDNEFRRYFAQIDLSDTRYYIGYLDKTFSTKEEAKDYAEEIFSDITSKTTWKEFWEKLEAADKVNPVDLIRYKTMDNVDASVLIESYINVKVYPYGLLQMYEIAGVDKYSNSFAISTKSNVEVLDYYEKRTRSLVKNVDMGISYAEERSPFSITYSFTQTGRSADTYVDLSSSLYADLIHMEEWMTQNAIKNSLVYTPTGESKILDFRDVDDPEYSYYINQHDYAGYQRGTSETDISRYGCCDCCYVMCAQYLTKQKISVVAASKKFMLGSQFNSGGYTNSDGERTSNGFLDAFSLYQTRNDTSFDMNAVIRSINLGSPVIFHLTGPWLTYYSGKTHFIVIIGYDDTYFYVLNPAKEEQIRIPLTAFVYAPIDSWRSVGNNITKFGTIQDTTSDVARYIINQTADGKERVDLTDPSAALIQMTENRSILK